MDKVIDDGHTMMMVAEVVADPANKTYVPVVYVKNISGTGGNGEPTFSDALTNDELRAQPLMVSIAATDWAMPVSLSTEENLPVEVDDTIPIRAQIVEPLASGTNVIGSVGIDGSLPSGSNHLGEVSIAGPLGIEGAVNINGVVPVSGTVRISDPISLTGGTIVGLVDGTTVTVAAPLPAGNNHLGSVSVESLPAGSNNIGVVTVAGTSSISGTVTIGPGTAAIGSVSVTSAIPTGMNRIGTVGIADPIPTGPNVIGKVGIDGSLPIGTNPIGTVALNSPIPAGTSHIGSVSIDTPLPAGTNNIGTVTVSGTSTVSGSVSVTGPLPAGSNNIGTVGVTGAVSLGAGSATIGNVGINAALPAGTGHLGSVTIDTPLPTGTNTLGNVNINGPLPIGNNAIGTVSLNASIPAGANKIGTVGISDPLPTGTNNIGNVGLNSSLPTGTNTIGNVTVSGGLINEDAAANLNPVLVGAVVRTSKAPATLIAGDLSRLSMNPEGSLLTSSGPVATSTELASSVIATSGTSGVITNVNGGSITGQITVSAVSGSNPTLDIIMEESYDNGTSWNTVWSANRINAISKVNIPNMVVLGLRRWSWVVGGTTPSFTVSVVINSLDTPGRIIRNLFDRGISQVTLGSSSAALYVEGCTNLTAFVQSGGGTTAANYAIQLSPDGVNWATSGSSLTALLNNGSAFSQSGVNAKWARLSIVNIGLLSSQVFAELRASS